MAWAPAYATADDLKVRLGIAEEDTGDDDILDLAVEAASRAVDLACSRQFGKVDEAEARLYAPEWRHSAWVVQVDDLMADPESVTVDGTAVDVVAMRPLRAAPNGRPWTLLQLSSSVSLCSITPVEVTAEF